MTRAHFVNSLLIIMNPLNLFNMNRLIKKLIVFTSKQIKNVFTPKTIQNRIASIGVLHYADEKFIDIRKNYLGKYLEYQDTVIKMKRTFGTDFESFIDIIPNKERLGCDLLLYKNPGNDPFINDLNKMSKGMHVSKLDTSSQSCYSDIWDHLVYGLIVATCAAELGKLGGLPGTITEAKLAYQVKEANGTKSCGPFGINSSQWKMVFKVENLPSDNYYVHASHFFHKAKYCHDHIVQISKDNYPKFFESDPTWLVELYSRGDLISYILLFRRYYGGTGDWDKLEEITSGAITTDNLAKRSIAFLLTTLSVMKARDKFEKAYPTGKFSDPAEFKEINRVLETLIPPDDEE